MQIKIGMLFKCINSEGVFTLPGETYEIKSIGESSILLDGTRGAAKVSIRDLQKKFVYVSQPFMTQEKTKLYQDLAMQYPRQKGFIYTCVLNDRVSMIYDLLEESQTDVTL